MERGDYLEFGKLLIQPSNQNLQSPFNGALVYFHLLAFVPIRVRSGPPFPGYRTYATAIRLAKNKISESKIFFKDVDKRQGIHTNQEFICVYTNLTCTMMISEHMSVQSFDRVRKNVFGRESIKFFRTS